MQFLFPTIADAIYSTNEIKDKLALNVHWLDGTSKSKKHSIIPSRHVKIGILPIFISIQIGDEARLGIYSRSVQVFVRVYTSLEEVDYTLNLIGDEIVKLFNNKVFSYNSEGKNENYQFLLDGIKPIREDEAIHLLYREVVFTLVSP